MQRRFCSSIAINDVDIKYWLKSRCQNKFSMRVWKNIQVQRNRKREIEKQCVKQEWDKINLSSENNVFWSAQKPLTWEMRFIRQKTAYHDCFCKYCYKVSHSFLRIIYWANNQNEVSELCSENPPCILPNKASAI